MMLRAVIIAIIATTVSPGQAPASDVRADLGPLALSVAAWVTEATGLPLPATMPEIHFASPRDIPALMAAVAPSSGSGSGSEIVAFYNAPERAIVLPAGWTGESPAELSVLVHEMVHHAQTSAERRFACPAEREREAYDAQTRFLALFGTDLTREFGMDRMFLLVATTCGMP
jgi:hypothetical protein